MRRVLLTGTGPEHRYVANRLAREVGLAAVVVDHGPPLSRRARLRQLVRRYGWRGLPSRAALRALRALWGDARERPRQIEAVLGAEAECFREPGIVHEVRGINRPAARALLDRLAPDRLLVYGTGIVGARVLSRSRLPPLNMHTGISPDYRGSDCAFWPIHNGELDRLGATVHECTARVDAGRIFATGRARLAADDGLFAVFARCVAVGADLYVRVLRDLERDALEGEPQDPTRGREYRAAMRGPRAEWRVRRAIARGAVRRFVEPQRS